MNNVGLDLCMLGLLLIFTLFLSINFKWCLINIDLDLNLHQSRLLKEGHEGIILSEPILNVTILRPVVFFVERHT